MELFLVFNPAKYPAGKLTIKPDTSLTSIVDGMNFNFQRIIGSVNVARKKNIKNVIINYSVL